MSDSMIRELLVLGFRLSSITFVAAFIGLLFLFVADANEDLTLIVSAALTQAIVGIIACRAGEQIHDENCRRNSKDRFN